ncbi:hypothetical protein Tco_0585920 [Tanacetum coccineum]
MIVEENLHVQFSENTPNIAGSGPKWLFDIDALTKSMNYKPVVAGNQSNGNASTKACDDAGKARMETVPGKDYILLPLWTTDPPFSQFCKNSESNDQEKEDIVNSTNNVNDASTNEVNAIDAKTSIKLPLDPNMPELEDIVYSDDDEDVGAEADMNNLDAFYTLCAIQLFDLVPYTDSDYAGASLDRKSTTGGENRQWGSTVTSPSGWEEVIVTEASVRRDLQLNDEEGTDCLLNATIFKELTRIGYEKFYEAYISEGILLNLSGNSFIQYILQCLSAKTTTWNEFSSTMASAIICLATNQKFNFSKYIFESMVKNLENVSGKFLMYPRFVQVFLEKQLEGMQSHKRIYVTPSHTKKIFRNMRRVGKGFSGRETPLFPTMMIQAQEEMGEETKIKEGQRIRDTEVPQNCAPPPTTLNQTGWQLRPVYGVEMDDSLERAATTATSLDAE